MLLHNNHDGTFTDVTEKAGVANERWGFGVAVGDDDNGRWLSAGAPDFSILATTDAGPLRRQRLCLSCR